MGVMDNYKYNKSQSGAGGYVDRSTKWSKQKGGGPAKDKADKKAGLSAPVTTVPAWLSPDLTRTETNMRGRDYSVDGPTLPTSLQQYHTSQQPVEAPAWLSNLTQQYRNLQQQSIQNAQVYVPPTMRGNAPQDMSAWRDQMQQNVDKSGSIYPAFPVAKTGAGGSVMDNYSYGQRTGVTSPSYIPTGSFIAANGQAVRSKSGAYWLPKNKNIPTGSFLAANGQAVLSKSGAYWLPQNNNIPTGSFLAANGTAVRIPNEYEKYLDTGSGYDGGGGGGGGWGGWGGGGGGGGGDYNNGYSPRMGLYSWNFKG